MQPLKTLLSGGDYYEAPRWHEGRWFVSDFFRHEVLGVTSEGKAEIILVVDGHPSGIGWLPDEAMVVVSMKDHRILRRDPNGTVDELANLSVFCGGRLNDLVVADTGHVFVGDFGFDLMGMGRPAAGSIMRVDPDGTTGVAAADLLFPNAMMITPDGGTLIVNETGGNRISAFDLAKDGTLGGRRVFAQFAETPALTDTFQEMFSAMQVGPDGGVLDADGHLWIADSLGGRACRLSPEGQIVEEIKAPDGLGFFACALGGPDGTTLLLCAAPDFFEHTRTGKGEAVLLTTEVAAPHAGRP
jgi:sugar lactone lactonase YvrE